MRKTIRLTTAKFAKQGDAFAQVNLPHTWNNVDGQDGGSDYWRGAGTYLLDLPAPTAGKRQFIEFRGANHVATVYCNGRELGTHKGGFSTFRYELTAAMKPKGNTMMVIVSNAKSNIYPQNADFTFFGGIYRDVSFIEVEQAHFDLMKTGSDAIFVTPASSGYTRIDMFTENAADCLICLTIKDAEGNAVMTEEVKAEPHSVVKVNIHAPHLWHGVTDPYCYTCTADLLNQNETIDTVTVAYGYRSYHIDADSGFHLNGRSYPLHGVCRHQDRLDKGWAIGKKEHEEDAALIHTMGANTIRLAHYQHDSYFYNLCDKIGFIVWAEIPFISEFNPSREAYENTLSQMQELIAQNYNHPSIVVWGISNEISMNFLSEAIIQNLYDVNALVKRLDPNRLTTIAQVSNVAINNEQNYITDVVSYNHYFGWYDGSVQDNGPWLDEFHRINPSVPIGLSEYGVEAILKWHTASPENHDYTEEYAAHYHHEMLKLFAERPYLWATHVWNMFDFAADSRNEGGMKGRNNKGLVTYDRKIKKDAYYIYQAYWTSDPMIHVCGERFADRAPGERNITVYTNCPEVTLVVNGKEFGTMQAVDHAVTFENVALNGGANNISAHYGEVSANTIVLNGVTEHNTAYDLPDEEGTAGNMWAENIDSQLQHKPLEYPEGFYSIRDYIGDLLDNPATAEALEDFLPGIIALEWNIQNTQDISPEIMSYYKRVQLSTMFRTTGKFYAKGTKQSINERLNKILK